MIEVLNSLSCSIIALNKDKKVLFVNKHLLYRLGKKENEIIGKDILQIISINEKFFDGDISVLQEKINLHFSIRNKANQEYLIEGQLIQDKFNNENAYYIISNNEYENKEYERSYKTKDLECLLDIIQAECWIQDMEGKYIYVNQRFADDFACEKKDIIGKTYRDFFDKRDWDFIESYEQKVIDNKKIISHENMYLSTGENKRWYNNTIGPIFDENNNIKYIGGRKLDITLQKFLNDTLQDSLNQINQISSDISYFNTDREYKSLIQNIAKNLAEFSKADGLSILYYNKEDEGIKVLSQTGEVIEAFNDKELNKGYRKVFQQCIEKYGEGMIDLNILREDKKFYNVHKKLIRDDFSMIGIYNMNIDKEIVGQIVITYKKGHEDRNIPFNYFKTICSYISINIENWKKCKKIDQDRKKYENINNSLMQCIDVSEDMISTWDLSGKPIYCNNQVHNVLGYTYTKDINFFEILPEDYKEEIINMMFNSDRDFGNVISQIKCSDNTYKWIDWNFKILKEENMFFSIGKDVTENIILEKRKLLVQEAQLIEEIRAEFLSNITHEFRTPINIILGTVQLINKSLENNTYTIEKLQKHIKYLKSNSNRLLKLVNNLIDITYIKNGYHELNLKNHNIVELVESICNTVLYKKENYNINIIFDTDCEELIMACDGDQIERIMLNLLSNAIKYSFPGDLITVSIKSLNKKVQISVKDNGIGIPSDYLDKIFEKLIRVDNNFTRNNEGSGIGLAIVKSLVNLHEGTITVESEVGRGSNFIITLPVKLVKEENKLIEKIYKVKNKVEKLDIEFSDIYDYNYN